MKTFVVLLAVVAVASAQLPLTPVGQNAGVGIGAPQGVNRNNNNAPLTGLSNLLPQPRNWGPRVWGAGANNPFVYPNPFVMERAVAVAEKINGLYVEIDDEGEVHFTNSLGARMKLRGPFGQEFNLDQ